MDAIKLLIYRSDSNVPDQGNFVEYPVPLNDSKVSALHALQYIYENIDSTLAFDYSCRYSRCGLCGVLINDKPRLACEAHINRGSRVVIKPLPGFPIFRDLVVDKSYVWSLISKYSLYIPEQSQWKEKVAVEKSHHEFLSCLECFCCNSSCPHWTSENSSEFGGPYIFVKLAQLHLDPRNTIDRKEQAVALGIEKCRSCSRYCICITGSNLCKNAIELLL